MDYRGNNFYCNKLRSVKYILVNIDVVTAVPNFKYMHCSFHVFLTKFDFSCHAEGQDLLFRRYFLNFSVGEVRFYILFITKKYSKKYIEIKID